MQLGDYVREIREKRGLSRAELAKLAGIVPSQITLVEQNKRPNISAETLGKLARALKVPVNDFYKLGQSDKAVVKEAPVRSVYDAFIELKNTLPIAVPVVADMHAPGKIMEYLYIPKPTNGHKNFYAVQIRGDCLAPAVENGDYIIIDKDDAAEPGKSVLCYHNGDEHPCIIKVKKPSDLAGCDVYGVILWIMKRP